MDKRKKAARLPVSGTPNERVGSSEHAILNLEKQVAARPNDGALADRLGDLHSRTGDVFRAVTYYRKAADAFERDDRLDKAIAVWRKVIRQLEVTRFRGHPGRGVYGCHGATKA
jgi:Flp pilus assembly protein TadD